MVSNEADKTVGQMSGERAAMNSAGGSMTYLEDIHIFALANMLCRPIIVISLETIRNIQPIHLRGIYLPLLIEPSKCVKDPILIAFHNFHFMPLVYALDGTGKSASSSSAVSGNGSTIKYNQRYFHFDNIDAIDSFNMDESTYDQVIKMSPTAADRGNFNIKRKHNQIYNILPLVYCYDLKKRMKIHFLNEPEQGVEDQQRLLEDYLTLVQMEIYATDLDVCCSDESSRQIPRDGKVTIQCCQLDSCSDKPVESGTSLYINYLNETVKQLSNGRSGGKVAERQTPSSFADTSFKKCKNRNCSNQGIEKFYDYCYECFRREVYDRQSGSYEVEPDKLEQQLELITLPRTLSPPSPPATRPPAYTYYTTKVCANASCANIIQSSSLNVNESNLCESCSRKYGLAQQSASRTLPINSAPSLPLKQCYYCKNPLTDVWRTLCDDCFNLNMGVRSVAASEPVSRCRKCHTVLPSNIHSYCDNCLSFYSSASTRPLAREPVRSRMQTIELPINYSPRSASSTPTPPPPAPASSTDYNLLYTARNNFSPLLSTLPYGSGTGISAYDNYGSTPSYPNNTNTTRRYYQ
jgi:hypothetical protein